MRHLKKSKKFHRNEEERKRLWTDLCAALIKSGKITTFTMRAKYFRPKFERMVTLCKNAGENKQLAFKRMRKYFSEEVSRKMLEEVVPKFATRQGGYTQQFKLMREFSDKDMSVVCLVD